LQSARDQAEHAARITRAQLREGRADSLAVLDAERTLAQAEADLAESDARLVDAQVDLFRALGGGWQSAPTADRIAISATGERWAPSQEISREDR
jgi:outer membrane protein TolC